LEAFALAEQSERRKRTCGEERIQRIHQGIPPRNKDFGVYLLAKGNQVLNLLSGRGLSLHTPDFLPEWDSAQEQNSPKICLNTSSNLPESSHIVSSNI